MNVLQSMKTIISLFFLKKLFVREMKGFLTLVFYGKGHHVGDEDQFDSSIHPERSS